MPKVSTKEEKKVTAAAPEKKKRAKKEKDPNKPKRWVCFPSSFHIFFLVLLFLTYLSFSSLDHGSLGEIVWPS